VTPSVCRIPRLLGIAPDVDTATLRQAWRRFAERWHPDRSGTDTTFDLLFELTDQPQH